MHSTTNRPWAAFPMQGAKTADVVSFLMHKTQRIEAAKARLRTEMERERLFRHLMNQYGEAPLSGICHALEEGNRAIDEGHDYLTALRAAKRILGAPAYQRGKLA